MKTRFRVYCLVFLSLLTAGLAPAMAQPRQKALIPAQIDQFITRLMDSANVPGLSIAIIRENKVAYSQGYGLTKADSTQRVTSATIFDAASLSKPVFAYTVLQLVEEGLLDLDKPLYEYLPYPDVATDERYKKITARLVLSHSSGFPNWRKNRGVNEMAMKFTPGERFGYSGEGFVYLQRVVEQITGKPINERMTERVFKPLGMTRSSYVWTPAFDDNFALPHNSFAQPQSKGKSNQANVAYSLQTTADDYARFVLAIMTAKGLKPATIDQMLSRQRQLPNRFSETTTLSPTLFWGLGFGLETSPSGDYFWHWGDNGTYKCYITADRKRGNAVVYFTNSSTGLSVAYDITRQFVVGNHPAPAFLGYNSYKDPNNLFTRAILQKGVSAAIAPYLKDGKSTLDEDTMNDLGYELINSGHLPEALAVLRYNMEAYPDSANTSDSYAYAHLANGNWTDAISYYNKTLTIKPDNDQAKRILAGLAAAQTGTGTTKLTLTGYPTAHLVTLAGSFNNWDNLQTFFVKKGDSWECRLDLKPGTYTYKVIVDGNWMVDPANPATQTDDQGHVNSVMTIGATKP